MTERSTAGAIEATTVLMIARRMPCPTCIGDRLEIPMVGMVTILVACVVVARHVGRSGCNGGTFARMSTHDASRSNGRNHQNKRQHR